MNQFFWYQVMYSDVRGVCHTKEGDMAANNVLHACKRIEEWNKQNWRGTLIYIRLFVMEWETGFIHEDPCLYWTRHGANGKTLREMDAEPKQQRFDGMNLDWDPAEWGEKKDYESKWSQTVTSDAERFDPDLIGTRWFKSHQTFATMTLKAKED